MNYEDFEEDKLSTKDSSKILIVGNKPNLQKTLKNLTLEAKSTKGITLETSEKTDEYYSKPYLNIIPSLNSGVDIPFGYPPKNTERNKSIQDKRNKTRKVNRKKNKESRQSKKKNRR